MKLKEKTDLKKHHASILNQTIELFNGIRSHFLPPNAPPELAAGFETSSFDVS